MPRNPTPLFSRGNFSDYERDQLDAMQAEISKLSSTDLENSTDSLALIFATKYTPSPIELTARSTEDVGQVEKRIDRSNALPGLPTRRNHFTRKYQRLKYKVHYSGRRDILLKTPRRVTHPVATYDELTDEEIVHYVDYQTDGKDPEGIKEQIDGEISEWEKRLERNLDHLNRDIQRMRNSFENRARDAIESQRKNMQAKDEALADFGITSKSDAQGFVEPEKKKDIDLPDLNGSNSESQAIRDRTFVDILDIIDSMKVNVERSKKRLRELDEESLRDIFLGAIDSHYGSATAESFNKGGKTDILLRHQGVNLFVAECKFWHGKSLFQEAIDQLLGNLTSVDSHAALLVFSDREKLTQVRERVDEAIRSHGKFGNSVSTFTDHDVYRFTTATGTRANVAVKIVNLTD